MTERRPGRPTEWETEGQPGTDPAYPAGEGGGRAGLHYGDGGGGLHYGRGPAGAGEQGTAGHHVEDNEGYGDDHDHYGEEHDQFFHDDDGHYYADDEGHYGDGDGGYGDGPDGGWPGVTGSGAPSYRRRSGGGRRDRGSGRRRAHPILTALVAIVVLAVLVVGGGLLWAQGQINPGGKRGPAVSVMVPKGASTSRIGQLLASAGVIHNGTLFAYYVRLHGDGPLYPGTYSLARNSAYSTAISALESGPKIITDNLVIPEGYTLRQIADAVGALPHMGLSASKFLAAATGGMVRSPYEPVGVNNLEGLVFPATYQVRQGETEVDILEQMVGAFNERADQLGLTAAASRLGYTPYQIVTVASIVERESKLPGDRGPVASAIYNRLKVGMKLGADSTQTYYLRLTNPTVQPTVAQLDSPSPYNTRTQKGLPPTPIANPGLDSLRAAISPPSTTYLYFVEVNPDGKLAFASTTSGFDSLQRQCRAANLC